LAIPASAGGYDDWGGDDARRSDFMLIGDPAPTQGDLHFSVLGIPVRVHPFFWLIALMLGLNSQDAGALIVWVIAVFIGVLVHEMGHALVMRRFGFAPWITLYGLGGMASYNPGGYGARSVGTWGQVLISAAGPLAGFLLAACLILALTLAGVDVGYFIGLPIGLAAYVLEPVGHPVFGELLNSLLFVTIAYGVLNLMPIYPLDGGQIARELFLRYLPRNGIRHSLMLSIIVGAALAVLGLLRGSMFMGILFGYLAFTNFQTLQRYQSPGRWQ
jgi:Zn-dependent protease